jgi:hypothetical protein
MFGARNSTRYPGLFYPFKAIFPVLYLIIFYFNLSREEYFGKYAMPKKEPKINDNHLLEMAAELFARLFWRHWLHIKRKSVRTGQRKFKYYKKGLQLP